MGIERFSDNTTVGRYNDHTEYLSVNFKEMEDLFPYEVSLDRYSVPGRYDIYDFNFIPSPRSGIGSRIGFFTDTGLSLPDALKLLHKDLNKKPVIEMLVEACSSHKYWGKQFCYNLLGAIAPDTKTYEAIEKLYKKS